MVKNLLYDGETLESEAKNRRLVFRELKMMLTKKVPRRLPHI